LTRAEFAGSVELVTTRPESPLLIDTHVHVISPDEIHYPLRPFDASGAGWHEEIRVAGAELLSLMDDAKVDGAVVVQAMSAYQDDNAYAADTAREHPGRFTCVGIVDAVRDGAPERLEHWVDERGVRGVRLWGLDETGFLSPDDERYVTLARRAADLSVPVVVFATADQLPALGRALELYPDVPVALDHCGFPLPEEGPAPGRDDALRALARFENLHLKVTTRVLEPIEAAGGDPREWIQELAHHFGIERLMWGSDFPASHARRYAEHAELARHCAEPFSPADRERFLAGTALALWPELGRAAGSS
jgi:predicted TIM-barrel fold metal-dependent hydrolase